MKIRLWRPWVSISFAALLAACGAAGNGQQKLAEQQAANAALQVENQQLKNRVAALEAEVTKLANTPERRLSEITRLANAGNATEAGAATAALKHEFPNAPEVAKAETLLAGLQAKARAAKEAAEQKERLGLKVLKEVKGFELPGLKIAVSPPQVAGKWTFDSYDTEYHYREASRGSRFLTSRLSITADKGQKDPALPGFAAYAASGKKLVHVIDLGYEFVRWDDYGSYLGNEADFRNDFAHTATIPFTIGGEISEDTLKQPLFLVASRSGCHSRQYNRFANPPVSYSGACPDLKPELSIEELASAKYAIVKIWNSDKL